MNLKLIIIALIITKTTANIKCSNQYSAPKYFLMEKCHRSKLGIGAKANFTSLASCQRLGIEKRALALNFSPPEAAEMGEPLDYSCEVLKCAESDGGLSLVNDTRYDYYSIYAKPLPDVNSTCVPATGMFFLITSLMNYTQAYARCKNMSGVLADVTSEQRTDALAQVLAGASVEAALVGMKRTNSSTYVGVNGDALDCTTYRAWSPGHPRRYSNRFDCMVITRQKSWRSTSCQNKYPALCELTPGGPYKRGLIFASRYKNETEINTDVEQNKV